MPASPETSFAGSGEPTELERLYDAHAPALFALILNLTRSDADTRDVLQAVFCRIATRPDLLAGVRNERAFLLRLAQNASLDWMRRRATREKHHEAFSSHTSLFEPSAHPDEEAFRCALSEAMAELPAEQSAVVHLKLWEDATFEQIAEALDISPNTAASRYRYALDKLRARLRPLYDEIKNLWTTSSNS